MSVASSTARDGGEATGATKSFRELAPVIDLTEQMLDANVSQ